MRKNLKLVLFLFVSNLFAQQVEWEKYIGGKHQDYLSDMIATADNGFLIAGSSLSMASGTKNSDNKGSLDYWIWKMNENGKLEWQKSFGGDQTDHLNQIKLTKDGGFILIGTSNSDKGFDKKQNSFGEDDIWVIKLNGNGVEEWQTTLGGTKNEMNPKIEETSDGFVIGACSSSDKTGNKTTENFGNYDYWITKINSKGLVEWQQSYGGIYTDYLQTILPTKDQGLILAGHSNSDISGNKTAKHLGVNDYWILKINKNGNLEWQKNIGGINDENLTEVIPSKNGGYYLAGSSNSDENNKNTFLHLIKIDEYANIIWENKYNYGEVSLLTTILENKDNTIMLGAYSKGTNSIIAMDNEKTYRKNKPNTDDYIVLKLNEKGETLWDKIIENDGEDILKKIIATTDGGFIFAGTNNVLQSKEHKNRNGSNDFWILKMKDKDLPVYELDKIKAVPNPSVSFTSVVIGFGYEQGKMMVVDMAGRAMIQRSINQRIEPIDMTNWAKGIYIANVQIGKENYSVKIIKNE